MTDAEIIKALECCFNNDWNKTKCNKCPFYNGGGGCIDELKKSILDLINRQQAENDDLFYKLTGVMHSVDKWLDGDELKQDEVNRAATMREKTLRLIETAKDEARKEFADKLKEKAHTQPIFDTYCGNKYMGNVSKVYVADIDNLVKEYEKGR